MLRPVGLSYAGAMLEREANSSVTLFARAKVNLVLLVDPALEAGHAKAGFHEIASWFACLDLHDDVVLTRLPEGAASEGVIRWASDAAVPTPIDWPIEKDLAVRAHRALEAAVGRALPARVEVVKRIPVGGGLGGGSSDAAAALIGLDRLFGLGFGAARLREIGMRLGSDVGFFVDDEVPARPAIVSGLGDVIERVEGVGRMEGVEGAEVLLAVPGFGCPTGAVYRAFDAAPTARGRASVEMVRGVVNRAVAEGKIDDAALVNDLATPAAAVQPRLRDVLATLTRELGGVWHLTGSGSCCYRIGAGPDGPLPRVEGVQLVRARLV
jgi:4-diphosphocytidyl-2-C-methyl-D-erythritol kinase